MSTAPNGSWETMVPRVVRLIQNMIALFRARADLAKQEARAAVRSLILGVLFAGVALLLLVMAVPIAIATLVLALAIVLPAWAATGVVLVALVLLAGGFFVAARRRFTRRRGERFMDGLREDWKTIRERVKSQ